MRSSFLSLLFSISLLQTSPTFAEEKGNKSERQITSFMSGLEVDTPKQAVQLWI